MINEDYPGVPRAIFDLATEDADLTYDMRCQEIWTEILVEILENDYINRSHHNVGTYDIGCRGPLCRKALREHPRRRSPTRQPLIMREERIFDPVLDYFHVVAKNRLTIARNTILQELKENA